MAPVALQYQSLIEPHLEAIERLLPSPYKLTLVARYTGSLDADIILTLDDLPQVIETLQRFAGIETE